jgi:hypothetical protein
MPNGLNKQTDKQNTEQKNYWWSYKQISTKRMYKSELSKE